ncbi:hypothetical protein KDN24_06385 [Bacillus sp. Bva_UNVM-123]
MKKYKCEKCGKFISDEEGVTALCGTWVCDHDSCRSLDNSNDATLK